jgi:putative phage-type endonuclease
MKIVQLSQRDPAWHEWRRGGVTASEAAVLLEVSKEKTKWRLWAEKVGKAIPEDLSRNPHVQRGIRLEDHARRDLERILFEATGQHEILLPVCGESEEEPLMRCSLDGMTLAGIPTELKCLSDNQWELVAKGGMQSAPFLRYYPQIQHQIYCCDAPYGILSFFRYNPETQEPESIAFQVERDQKVIDMLLSVVVPFMENNVKKGKAPKRDPERDLYIPEDDLSMRRWIEEAGRFKALSFRKDELQKQLSTVGEKLSAVESRLLGEMGSFLHADLEGVVITRFRKKGAVNYKSLLADKGLEVTDDELDRYRNKGSEQVRSSVKDRQMPARVVDDEIEQRIYNASQQVVKTFL